MSELTREQLAVLERVQQRRAEREAAAQSRTERHLGLTGRVGVEGAVSGALGLPALAYDGTVGVLENLTRQGVNLGIRGYNALTGSEVEQFGYRDPFATTGAVMEVGRRGADALGLPSPETAGERLAVDAGRGATSALTGAGLARLATYAPALPNLVRTGAQTLASNPVTQMLAGAGAGGGGEAADQAGEAANVPQEYRGPLRVAGSVVGGLAAAGTPAVAKATAQTAREMARPFTKAGQEHIVGSTLRQFARDPDAAVAAGQSGGREIVPGSRPTLGQATRDPGLLANENPIRSLDTQGRFAARDSANNTARNMAIDRVTRDADVVTAMRQNLDDWTTQTLNQHIFPNARKVSDNVAGRIAGEANRIARSPEGTQTAVRDAMRFVDDQIKMMAREGTLTDPQHLYSMRKNLQLLAEGRFNRPDVGHLTLAKGQLYRVIRTIDDVIEEGAPGFKQYMRQYADNIKEIKSYETVNQIRDRSRLATSDITSGYDFLSSAKLRNQVEGRARELGKDLNTTQRAVLRDVVNDLNRSQAGNAANMRVAGSDTVKNLSVANVVTRFFGGGLEGVPAVFRTPLKAIDWIYTVPSQRMTEMMVEAILDPKMGVRLMQQATPKRVESFLAEMVRRAETGAARAAIETGAAESAR